MTTTAPYTATDPASAPFEAPAPDPLPKRGRVSRRLVTGILMLGALAAAAALLFFAIVDGDKPVELGKPQVVSVDELRSFAADKGTPVFWAGPPAAGFKLELTEVQGGRTFVRYLSADAPAGDRRPAFTTVGTYAASGAYAKTKAAAGRNGAVLNDRGADGVVLWYRKAPANVYVAKPSDPSRLVEVYAPNAQTAQALGASSQVVPVK